MVASIGLSGAFYVMRRLVWGEGVSIGSHFFRGIKMNIWPFLLSSLFIGISLFLVMSNIGIYNNLKNIHIAWKIIGISLSIIQFVLLMSMAIFMSTQAVTYKLKIWPLIKNSFLFAIALLPTNILMLAFSALPFLLFLLPISAWVAPIMIFALIGFSYIMLIWTVYAHWAYDKFINDRVEGAIKNRGMHIKTEEEKKAAAERDRKNKNIRFNNPKRRAKKLTSIDEGETYTPLTATFSRADLMRLEAEKEAVKRSIDADYEEVYEDEDQPQENAEDTASEPTEGISEKEESTEQVTENTEGAAETEAGEESSEQGTQEGEPTAKAVQDKPAPKVAPKKKKR